jgi:hypothetical protein
MGNRLEIESEKEGGLANPPLLQITIRTLRNDLGFRAYFARADGATQFIFCRVCGLGFLSLIGFGCSRIKNLFHSLGLARFLSPWLARSDTQKLAPACALLSLDYVEHLCPISMSRSSLALHSKINSVVIKGDDKGDAFNINLAIYRLGKLHKNTP